MRLAIGLLVGVVVFETAPGEVTPTEAVAPSEAAAPGEVAAPDETAPGEAAPGEAAAIEAMPGGCPAGRAEGSPWSCSLLSRACCR